MNDKEIKTGIDRPNNTDNFRDAFKKGIARPVNIVSFGKNGVKDTILASLNMEEVRFIASKLNYIVKVYDDYIKDKIK
jgi:hypothetical protein